jgi:WD40 repeat protein
MQTCPPPEHLRQFLDDLLGADAAAALTQHLEGCAACRQALDRLSSDADSKNWRRLRETEPRSGNEPRGDFLRRLEGVLAPGSSLSRAGLQMERPPRAPEPRGDFLPTPAGYEILEKRGRGGIGVVYKARDLRLKRTVALKMLLTGVAASDEERARLRAEAEAVARLQHPHIVQIHEIGEQDGCPYLVLEFVEGRSLAECLDGTPQPPPAAARLLETLARAMHYAHQHGVVHRDLKPANILLEGARGQEPGDSQTGTRAASSLSPVACPLAPKISDFGLAKRIDEASQTQTGQVLGTPSYMAPEQARGQNKSIGPAADVYALGAILYQLLTGRPPFHGVTSVDTIMQVLHEEPVPPRRLQPRVPTDLETICLKCLAKEPRQRYDSALELAEDLRRFQAGEPIRARRVGLLGQGWRWCRRNPAAAGLLAAMALVLFAGGAAVTWSYRGAEAAREREALAHQREAEQRDLAELLRYYGNITQAEREWQMNNVAQADHLLDQCLPTEGRPDRRGWEWYYLKRLCHADLKTVEAHRAPISGLSFSPDGKFLATAAGDPGYNKDPRNVPGELTIWPADLSQPLAHCSGHKGRVDGVVFDATSTRLASVSADNTARLWEVPSGNPGKVFAIDILAFWRGVTPAFSPDGKTVAVPSVRELRLLNPETGETDRSPADHLREAGPCAYSLDGTLLAFAGGGSKPSVTVWQMPERRELYRLPIGASALALSPDGRRLAISHGKTVRLCDAATGKEPLTLPGHDGSVQTIAFSPDGRSLASGGVDQVVRVWDVETGQEVRIFRGHTGSVRRLAYHPDGTRIASGDDGGVIKVWEVGRHQRAQELSPADHVREVAFTADGTQLRALTLLGTGGFRGWEVATGHPNPDRPIVVKKRDEWPLRYFALSRDGRLCAGPDPDNPATLNVWDVESGKRVLALTGHRTGIRSVAFSPDGRLLAAASGEKEAAEPRDLFVWQLPEPGRGEPSRIDLPCEAPVQSLAFSADGRRLVAGERGTFTHDRKWADGRLSVWDATTARQLHRWPGHPGSVQGVAFDPKGRWIASAGRMADQAVRLWDAETGRLLHDLRGPQALTCVAFHPDGTRLAAVGYSGTVHLWDPANGLDVITLRGPGLYRHESIAYDTQAVFSPDGSRIAVNSWTGKIHVWDARPLAGK